MKDNMDERLDQLFTAARSEKVEDAVSDHYFETRLMARIKELHESTEPWYAAAWRLLPAFAAVAAMIMVCMFTFTSSNSNDIFAAITTGQDEMVAISYLTGE